ncbi:MAG: hypothetical protein ABMA13_02460 [Chthoniobacteraceae bacterium]
MNAVTDATPAPTPLSAEVAEAARALVREFPECFWFRHPDAPLKTVEEARLVVLHLREYGGHRAWREAQRLHSCL